MTERSAAKRPLRVGVFIGSFDVPRWVRRAIGQVRGLPEVTVAVVVRPRAGAGWSATASPRWRHWLFDAYARFEERTFHRADDVLAPDTVAELLAGVPVVEVDPPRGADGETLSAADVERLRSLDLDVLLSFGCRLTGEALHATRHGVWIHEPGGDDAAFWEVVEGHPVTASGLRRLGPPGGDDAMIYRSLSPTDRNSVRRTRRHVYGKGAEFAARKLRDLHDRGPAALTAEPMDGTWARPRTHGVPGNLRMGGALARLGGRLVVSKWREWSSITQWRLGVQDGGGSIDPPKVEWLRPPRDRTWADPFPVWSGDRCYLFVEERVYREGRAYIAVMERARDGTWTRPVPVLRRDYHLSYPFVFEWDGAWYMIPEAAENRAVELFRCRSFPHEWEPYEVLLPNVNAADATVFQVADRWWMLCAIGAGEHNWDELHVFHAERPVGPWRAHRRNPVKSDVRSARPAGRVFIAGDELRRPAQDCSERYGYAISIQRIDRLSSDEYREREVERVDPARWPGVLGVHTLNRIDGLTVIDALVRVPRYGQRGAREADQAGLRATKTP